MGPSHPAYQRTVEENTYYMFRLSHYQYEDNPYLNMDCVKDLRKANPVLDFKWLAGASAGDLAWILEHLAGKGNEIWVYDIHFQQQSPHFQVVLPAAALRAAFRDYHCRWRSGNALAMALVLHHQGLLDKLIINLEGPELERPAPHHHGSPYNWSHNPPMRSYALDDMIRWQLQLLVDRGLRPYVVYGCCVSLPVDIGELAN